MKKLISKWYLVIVAGFLLFAGLVFLLCGEDSIIAVHDNLDLFIPQYQMMKDTGTFFAQDAYVPFLGGISRDVLPAEFSLSTFLYMILPAYPAYVAGYLLKIVIALVSCNLLAKDFCGEAYPKYKPLVYILGLAYGVLNMFPAFGISFASIPLAVYLVRKIYKDRAFPYLVFLFFYPLVSYFSYFGLFILAYMAAAFLWLWLRNKKPSGRLFLAIIVLSAGYMVCEYRLFGTMLFSEEESIRSTMVAGSLSASEILKTAGEVFVKGMFHAESVHTYLVLPVCVFYFLYLNFTYLKKKNVKGIFHDVYNLLMLVLLFNSAVYGLYYWEGFRNLIELLCPPLTGWQFNRTVFFSPFVWYSAFFLVLKRLYDIEADKKARLLANVLALMSVILIVLTGSRYNDLYHTCYEQVYTLVKGGHTDQLSYREFYSEELFEQAKEDIGYCGQWSAAYGFYPAVLEYNGISTVDGYLGFYSQSYKEEFRKVIAPALERMEATREYYDEWGARAYLYSGTELSIVSTTKGAVEEKQDIYIDMDAFKALGGRYIFSRLELGNAEEAGLTLVGTYTHEASPYTLYVYQTSSRYQTPEHGGLTFEERSSLTYDEERLKEQTELLKELAEEAERSGEAKEPEKVVEAYYAVLEELEKLCTCQILSDIICYQDVSQDESWEKREEILVDAVELQDDAYAALRKVCSSAYAETMKEVMQSGFVESFAMYEEQTDREKEITLQESSLIQEYNQAAEEEYSIWHQGEEWTFERFYQEAESLSQEDYVSIYQALSREKNSVLGEIYLDLVALRNEKAELAGYDSYAEYAYEELYTRDYSLDEMKELLKEIKKKVIPLMVRVKEYLREQDYSSAYYEDPQVELSEIIEWVKPYLAMIDPELSEGMEYMLEYGLYDVQDRDYKAEVGFTSGMPYYQDAFLFLSPCDDSSDYSVIVHEYGHYNYSYRNTENMIFLQNNIDVCEIHSQGLEALFYEYFKEELGEEISCFQIYQLMTAVTEVALISEFEISVYENPDMSLEELNQLYYSLSSRYGTTYVDGVDVIYSWCEISHLFETPCYYVSYLTSALSSLDLFTIAETDRHEAVETYMELTALPSYMPYCSAIEWVGLRDIFETGTARDIIEETAKILGVM